MKAWLTVAIAGGGVALLVAAGIKALLPSALPGGDAHVDGPLLVSAAPGVSRGGMMAEVSGTVSFEEGCVRLDGLPVVWPSGTEWNSDTAEVVLPDGQRVGAGDAVSGGGGYIAQRHFRPGQDPYGVFGAEGFDLIADCAGPSGEVAFFNLGSEVTVA